MRTKHTDFPIIVGVAIVNHHINGAIAKQNRSDGISIRPHWHHGLLPVLGEHMKVSKHLVVSVTVTIRDNRIYDEFGAAEAAAMRAKLVRSVQKNVFISVALCFQYKSLSNAA